MINNEQVKRVRRSMSSAVYGYYQYNYSDGNGNGNGNGDDEQQDKRIGL
jgi:hypothetical protein